MPMLGLLLKLLNQWVPPPYLRWLLLGINLHQLDLEQHRLSLESPPPTYSSRLMNKEW